ncbi:MAG: endo alpha-1,4 polygalactosaminidase [Vicinamibacterales bacterium]
MHDDTAIARAGLWLTKFATSALVCFLGGPVVKAEPPVRWAVCYSDGPAPSAFDSYQVVVLDAVHHPSLETMRGTKTLLAYVPILEIGRAHTEFTDLQQAGAVLDAHPDWTGSHYVDARHAAWRRTVLERIVPQALESGFTGLFLDTLDDAGFLEAQDPERYRGMRDAAIRLVRAIRERHPRAILMVNRGFDLMADIAPHIDMLLGESVLTTFEGATRQYVRRPVSDVTWQVEALQRAKGLNPSLRLFTLDYWDPSDTDGLRRIYREQRALGFSPYVSTPMLDTVVEEPR